MKKQTAMVLSLSALLAIGAMAPHILWQADKASGRAPASIEQRNLFSDQTNKLLIEKTVDKKDHMEKLLDDLAEDTKKEIKKREEEQAKVQPLKELEKVEITSNREVAHVVVLAQVLEEKKLDVEAQVSCLKEKQPADLEAQIKKLVEDKEAIMKELAELKKAKKDEPKIDEKKDKKENKVASSDNTEDVLGIMSQLTSLMISQQQQQMLMMNQMFSMFQMQQPKQQSYYQGFSPLSDYMSPYAFNASSFVFPSNESPYSLSGFNSKIGINSDFRGAYSSFDRTPAATQELGGLTLERSSMVNSESFQPQALEKRPHNGFDFTRTQY